ncbi:MAG: acetyl-CoA carboxylase biotin carboxyl carrier protein [Sedimentisphaerales bacterium]|nr:acetyl-CoA carboxylase biotin carboxyl carrier protein [Sedimentisphaerales bacterium]
MDITKIRELVEMMEANDLSEMKIVDGDTKIELKRGTTQVQYAPVAAAPAMPASIAAPAASSVSASAPAPAATNYLEVKSPIVGTFYSSPAPDAAPFVKVGDQVTPDTVVCIVEAMKVMNEVKAELRGTVKKILVENAQAVEFGQVMFLVEP